MSLNTLLIATCARGLEHVVAAELIALGAHHVRETRAAVHFVGDQTLALRAMLWLRCASRVLWPLTTLDAHDAQALYDSLRAFDYGEQFDPQATLAIDVVGRNDALSHSQFVAQKAKDAICDQLKARTGKRPSVDLIAPGVRLHVHVESKRAQLALDMGGAPLHQRGYRVAQADAPLKETLAAAILLKAHWPDRAARGEALIDPLCGSGTILIEAARIAADIAPQLERTRFGIGAWRALEIEAWNALLDDARARAVAGRAALTPRFFGGDIDAKALSFAARAASAAGVDHALTFRLNDLSQPLTAQAPALIISNPPYGERLLERREALKLHQRLGHALRASEYASHEAAILTLDRELAEALDRPIRKISKLYNGTLECALFELKPAREKRVAAEPESRLATLSDGAQMLANRLRKTARHLRSYLKRDGVEAWRLYDAELPEYSAAIDVYGDRVHLQEYRAPKSIPEDVAAQRLNEIVDATISALELPRDHLHVKQRRTQKGAAQYARRDDSGAFFPVAEGGLKFLVNLTDYLDTGLFLDHRQTRAWVRAHTRERRVLNLFSYTGAFSVHAASGGAREVVSVDLSPTYAHWAKDNFRLNGIDLKRHTFIESDVIEFVDALDRDFDLIVCDPPTFSNSKRADDFDVQRDHADLLSALADRLAPAGQLIFSTNFRRFVPDVELFSALGAVEITPGSLPPDFARSPKIHRCWRIDNAP